MPVDVIMPQMGESIAEGTLVKWLKKPGEPVARDENLFEISTDKVDAEIPSPAAGTLGDILVQEGQTVEVGTLVATILEEGEAAAEGEKPVESEEEAKTAEAEAPVEAVERTSGASQAASAAAGGDGGGAGNGSGGLATKEELRRTRSSPLVRNIAREHGIDISQVEGSGLSGRVTKRDILAYVEGRGEAPPAPAERPAAVERAAAPERLDPAAVAASGAAPRPFA
ncbi:MAG TPA: biotin/lipoyl-containing protein, partial [Gemmatimonadota bacterium]|nr:biotin/lipoyl-containing protein [Gemmatimonadota bacterium]